MSAIYTLYTLFDITHTGIIRGFVPKTPPYPDWAGQLIKNRITWDRSRNQQRNWECITQLLNLRTLARPIGYPVKTPFCDAVNYKFGSDFSHYQFTVWQLDFTVSQPELLDLEADFDYIPLVSQLNERVFFDISCLRSSGSKCNIYFQEKI